MRWIALLAAAAGIATTAIVLAMPASAAACDTPLVTHQSHYTSCGGSTGYYFKNKSATVSSGTWTCTWEKYTYSGTAGTGTVVLATLTSNCTTLGDKIVYRAQLELGNTSRNKGLMVSGTPCNYYTGQVVGASSACASAGKSGWGRGEWCADFGRWVWKTVGANVGASLPADGGRLDYWADSFRKYGNAMGTLNLRTWTSYTPQPGDAVVFDWDRNWTGQEEDAPPQGTTEDGAGGRDIDHVGIVEKMIGSTVYVISGNSGNAITRLTYSRTDTRIYAFISPR